MTSYRDLEPEDDAIMGVIGHRGFELLTSSLGKRAPYRKMASSEQPDGRVSTSRVYRVADPSLVCAHPDTLAGVAGRSVGLPTAALLVTATAPPLPKGWSVGRLLAALTAQD